MQDGFVLVNHFVPAGPPSMGERPMSSSTLHGLSALQCGSRASLAHA
jgi:hypothetical protein